MKEIVIDLNTGKEKEREINEIPRPERRSEIETMIAHKAHEILRALAIQELIAEGKIKKEELE